VRRRRRCGSWATSCGGLPAEMRWAVRRHAGDQHKVDRRIGHKSRNEIRRLRKSRRAKRACVPDRCLARHSRGHVPSRGGSRETQVALRWESTGITHTRGVLASACCSASGDGCRTRSPSDASGVLQGGSVRGDLPDLDDLLPARELGCLERGEFLGRVRNDLEPEVK